MLHPKVTLKKFSAPSPSIAIIDQTLNLISSHHRNTRARARSSPTSGDSDLSFVRLAKEPHSTVASLTYYRSCRQIKCHPKNISIIFQLGHNIFHISATLCNIQSIIKLLILFMTIISQQSCSTCTNPHHNIHWSLLQKV